MKKRNLKRRDILKAGATGTASLGLINTACSAAGPNLIQIENAKQGSDDWQLTTLSRSTHSLEGYASKQSVSAGEKLELKISCGPAIPFKIEIFRTGYYQGKGARKVHEIGPLEGKTQSIPKPSHDDKRLVECQWETSAELTIPDTWISGVYLARLSSLADKESCNLIQNYIVFIVKDERPCDLLFQASDNTWQAYNAWGGASLYKHPKGNQRTFAHVSFDRPYGRFPQGFASYPQSTGSGEWLLFEFPMAHWLEREGYDVSYCSNSDLLTPDRALKSKAFLSVGHDEYWDIRQHDSVMKLRNEGVSLLFFSANSCCWVSPMMPSSDGLENRVTHRGGPYGGDQHHAVTREKLYGPYPHRGPDEGLLMGARNIHRVVGHGDWTCDVPEHWIFQGTGMKKGESIQALVGWELHGNPATEIPGLEIVGRGTAVGSDGKKEYTATIYPGPKENFVFNAATIYWSQGLPRPPGHILPKTRQNPLLGYEERVETMTRNLVNRAIA